MRSTGPLLVLLLLGVSEQSAQPALPVIAREIAAYNKKDVNAFVACYASDVIVSGLPGGRIFVNGKDALSKRWTTTFGAPGNHHLTVDRRIVHGSFEVDYETITPGYSSAVDHSVAIYHVVSGAIDRVWYLIEQ
ncbi:MAG TPA: nuclear transport factor 2 family protein [Candidatus Baltobacteraceae bacterium]|jgi:hypothetical protein|nr:nuclear transport factor 2 family protein [Candidatus Baltobacteraceae bacterium]